MANVKISQLTPNANPTAAGELAIVESGVTDKVTAQDLITKAHGLGNDAILTVNAADIMTPISTLVGAGEVLTADGSGNVSFAAIPPSGQTTYDIIVAPSGGDYTSLSAALAAAVDGDSIFIRSGTYASESFNSSVKRLNIVGENKDNVKIQIASSTTCYLGEYVNISNVRFEFSNTVQTRLNVDNYANVNNCYFYNSNNSTNTFGVGVSSSITNCVFETLDYLNGRLILLGTSSIFSNNHLILDDGSTGSLILLDEKCICSNNAFEIYQETSSATGYYIESGYNGSDIISNNTLYHKQSGYYMTFVKLTSGSNNVSNNYVQNIKTFVELTGADHNIIESNTVVLNYSSGTAKGVYQSTTNRQYNTITGNMFYGSGANYIGVDIANGCEYFKISDNFFRWCVPAIKLGTTVDTQVTNNKIFATSTVDVADYIQDDGSATHSLGNNGAAVQEKNQVTMKNASGGSLANGDLVVIKDVAAGNEITTTTTAGDDKVFGVVSQTIADGEYGKVQTLGKVTTLQADGTAAIVIGDFLATYTTAKTAAKATTGDMAFAIALEALPSGTGQIDALLISPRLL